MRASLPVIELGETQEENLEKVIRAIDASIDCDFVFFAETTVSGFIPNDNASEMLALGQKIPGEITGRISEACVKNNVWVSIGLLEKEEGKLFDTAIVINSSGEMEMKYRRLSPGWHWPNSDPDVFCQGESVLSVETPFGKMACLICGDFFDEQRQIEQVAILQPDFLHLLLVRTGGEGVRYSQEEWDNNDIPDYSERTKLMGIPVLMVNYILDDCYGGATVLSGDGSVASSLPIWQEGILKYELNV